MGKTRQAKIEKKGQDHHLTVQEHSSDAPSLPVHQMQQLHQFRPDLIDQFWDETKKEADHRREIESNNAKYHRELSQRAQKYGFIIVLLAIIIGGAIAITSNHWIGASIALVPLLGIVASYFSTKK
jgi:uncharacterized membrane protein